MAMKDILVVGVGGQGTLLASRILGALFAGRGYDVKLSEVHGMAQRGGSVVTYVRAGETVASPLVSKGEADLVIAFEELEGLRWAPVLKKDGVLIVNTQQIAPMPVITGAQKYPENIIESLKENGVRVVAFNALEAANKAGSVKAVNTAILGVSSKYLDFTDAEWDNAFESTIKPKFLELNRNAFLLGREMSVRNEA
ncbi:MAG: indolepyruvate oxidoreductase subunit beta [Bacillota bacterium]|nr:indolepyruvate oxidoreductase subunit beta [Bacillota bacterium]